MPGSPSVSAVPALSIGQRDDGQRRAAALLRRGRALPFHGGGRRLGGQCHCRVVLRFAEVGDPARPTRPTG